MISRHGRRQESRHPIPNSRKEKLYHRISFPNYLGDFVEVLHVDGADRLVHRAGRALLDAGAALCMNERRVAVGFACG